MPAIPFQFFSVTFYRRTNVLFEGEISGTHVLDYTDTGGFKMVFQNEAASARTVDLQGERNAAPISGEVTAESNKSRSLDDWVTKATAVVHVAGETPFQGKVYMTGRRGDVNLKLMERGTCSCGVKWLPSSGNVGVGVAGQDVDSTIRVYVEPQSFEIARKDYCKIVDKEYRVEKCVPMKNLAGATHHLELKCEEADFKLE